MIFYFFVVISDHRSSPGHLPVIDDNESVEKDEGISDDEDPAELKVLLELNEQVKM